MRQHSYKAGAVASFPSLVQGLILLGGLLCICQPVAARISAGDLRLTRFGDILDTVMVDTAEAQQAFVIVALDVMIDAYLLEIRRVDELRGDQQANQASWRAGTLSYVRKLEQALENAERGANIYLAQEADGSVRFVIAGEQIMFHAPRVSEQGGLEASLVDHYCLQKYCRPAKDTIEDKTRDQMENLAGHWEFSSKTRPTYTAGDGLKCLFQDQRHLTLKREACKSLIFELRFLAEALKALRAKGSRIDWDKIAVSGGGKASPNKFTYNGKREYFHARLPNLWRAQSLLRAAMPWIQARTLGNVREFAFEPPDTVTYSGP